MGRFCPIFTEKSACPGQEYVWPLQSASVVADGICRRRTAAPVESGAFALACTTTEPPFAGTLKVDAGEVIAKFVKPGDAGSEDAVIAGGLTWIARMPEFLIVNENVNCCPGAGLEGKVGPGSNEMPLHEKEFSTVICFGVPEAENCESDGFL